jgi:hypothetical protein
MPSRLWRPKAARGPGPLRQQARLVKGRRAAWAAAPQSFFSLFIFQENLYWMERFLFETSYVKHDLTCKAFFFTSRFAARA